MFVTCNGLSTEKIEISNIPNKQSDLGVKMQLNSKKRT